MGWWLYESPFRNPRHPGIAHERSILYEFSDVLSADERAQLETQWREEFERCWSPNFSFFSGGKIYSGDVARELHWLWADLPPPLLDELMSERERRGRVDRAPPTGRAAQGEGKQAGSPLENERAG
jgi:hypothetical protein